MQTPYQILDVAVDANDKAIKQAYLQQVKNNPPDRNQQRFQLIHDTYTSIKDHKSRVAHNLFTLQAADFNTILDKALHTKQVGTTVSAESFNKLLSISMDDTSLLNAFADADNT
ncbi:molecular chaperone DnaJ [Bathymodiolus japonicus methanotrophic gill symbiont]|uniref:J domain-containing protein n=1 Tax=Bathymodiolus japonicus methanotrophic gill symbiont TaxID=113269 RepID=UPI001B664660|nr:J domain-containing protein [Bathymodiolus japonicus methanotrophic gill symbiont]GFO70976.1 molecular chaperone DnaJ [Bathymodiolus japonicus methanotrophic gill symbiont]